MNIDLFIESLSDSEKEELKNYFIKQESAKVKEQIDKDMDRIHILEFVNRNKISPRIANIILYTKYKNDGKKIIEDGFYFNFSDQISWEELELILKENNLPIR